MDQTKIPQNPYNPPPEIPSPHRYTRSNPTGNHPPSITRASVDGIESVFSRLSLSQDFHPNAQTPPLYATQNAAVLEKHQPLFWGQTQTQNQLGNNGVGGVNGLVGGAHQREMLGGGPFVDPLKLMSYYQRQDLGDYYGGMHGKQTRVNAHLPYLPSNSSLYGFSDNNSIMYGGNAGVYGGANNNNNNNNNNNYLYQQQMNLENMRGNFKLDERLTSEEVEVVLSDVIEYIGDLMMNQFGSHYVQNLFMVCNEDQKTRIIMAICRFPFKLVSICLNSHGARTVQKLLEKLIMPQQIWLVVSALSHGVYALATDANGQHVIQYCVKHFHGEYNRHLLNEIAENCFKIGTNKSGCCVLQSCVEHSHGEARDVLISHIIANAIPLAEDPYGNYVVQHLLGMRRPEVTAELLRQFQGYFVSMSCNKYASNVVEKFLVESGENYSSRIIMELLRSPKASMLLLDPYGNFVIQSALSESKEHVRDALLNLIEANASSMQTNLYGKKILAWFGKRNHHKA